MKLKINQKFLRMQIHATLDKEIVDDIRKIAAENNCNLSLAIEALLKKAIYEIPTS